MLLEEYTSRNLKERRSGPIFCIWPEGIPRFDSIRLGSDAMGTFFLPEVRRMMEAGGKEHEHPHGDAA